MLLLGLETLVGIFSEDNGGKSEKRWHNWEGQGGARCKPPFAQKKYKKCDFLQAGQLLPRATQVNTSICEALIFY